MPRKKGSARIPGSGRKKGTPNHTTEDIAAFARLHSRKMVENLVRIANDVHEPAATQVAAANSVLDRAHGKPTTTALLGGTGSPITIVLDYKDSRA